MPPKKSLSGYEGLASVYVHDGTTYQFEGGRIFIGAEDPVADGFTMAEGDQWVEPGGTADALTGKGFVNHGAVAGTARPTGYASIEWFGTVEPTNAIDGDTWNNPSA